MGYGIVQMMGKKGEERCTRREAEIAELSVEIRRHEVTRDMRKAKEAHAARKGIHCAQCGAGPLQKCIQRGRGFLCLGCSQGL